MLVFIVGAILALLLFFGRFFKRKGQAIFITGCDSGFGYALTENLLESGHTVYATHFTDDGLKALDGLKSCSAQNLEVFRLDVTNDDNVLGVRHAVTANLQERGIKLWGLVSNAGVNLTEGPSDWLTIADYQEHMNVNCYGSIRVCKAIGPLLRLSHGRIVIVTSIRGRLVFPGGGPYTLSKYALEAFADGLRQEMHYFGVKVAILEPGGFTTNINNSHNMTDRMEERWQNLDSEIRKYWPYATLERKVTRNRDTSNLTHVIMSFNHALFARYPLSRYIIGYDAWFRYVPLLFLPGYIQDWVMRKLFCGRNWVPVLPLERGVK